MIRAVLTCVALPPDLLRRVSHGARRALGPRSAYNARYLPQRHDGVHVHNVVLNAFAYLPGFRGSDNVSAATAEKHVAGYLQLAAVSLISARTHNPDCTVALVTNVQVPQKLTRLFEDWGIEVLHCPFDHFVFDASMKWSLAFYKLRALDHVVRTLECDNVVLLDTDTYVAANLDSLWSECSEHVLLFNVQHSLDIPQAVQMNREYHELFQRSTYLTNYGGEFVAGSRENLQRFVGLCAEIYQRMVARHFVTQHGDEFILSAAAEQSPGLIKDAGPYVHRYWTQGVYLVSTNYQTNPVCVWHLPAEKSFALPRAYRYLERHGRIPDARRMQAWCNFPPARRPFNPHTYWAVLKRTLGLNAPTPR